MSDDVKMSFQRLGLILGVMVASWTMIATVAVFPHRMEAAEKEIAALHATDEKHRDEIITLHRTLDRIANDVSYLRRSVDELKLELARDRIRARATP